MQSLFVAASGMLAQQMNVNVIANNLSNMNTTGYQRQRIHFEDLVYQDQRVPGAPTSTGSGSMMPTGLQLGLGVRPAAVYRIAQEGAPLPTEGPLDVAIRGKGYFPIQMPDGTTAYTRDGVFQLSPTRQIVTMEGYVVGSGIQIPDNETDITISAGGDVAVTVNGQTQTVGTVQLANFANPGGLRAMGGNLFMPTDASGQAVLATPGLNGTGSLLQGYREASNVDAVGEITGMIMAQRAYDMNSKVVQTSDEMMAALVRR